MFNKNTILSVMIIGSLVFLFFNQHGIITLMKKQSRNNKLKIELQNILEEKKNLKIENKNLDNLTEQEYEDLRKSKEILKKREKVLLKWSDSDKLNWLRSCASLGRDEEKCKCILGQLEIMYPSKQKMDIEMKKNPAGFSQSMISANKECN